MDFRGDERGQPVVIGALLIFAILILAFSGYQAFVVPNQNADVEIQHSQDVQSQMQDVRSTILRSVGVGTRQSTSIRLGVTYPSRLIALNPPPATGTLRTTEPLEVTIRNATVDGETGDYWDGSDRMFITRPLIYRPEYNVFDGAPTSRLEHSVLYNDFDRETAIPKSEQQIVSGRHLNFVFVAGNYSRSSVESVPFDVSPTSTSSNRVPLNASDAQVVIELETTIPEQVWVEELLADQIDGADGNEESCADTKPTDDQDADRYVDYCEYDDSTDPAIITLTLENGTTYELLLSKVGVGPDVEEPSEAYITDIEGNESTIPERGEQLLVAEVRDGFDNPVSGVQACAEVTSGPGNVDQIDVSDPKGWVSFTYEAPNDVGSTRDVEVTVGYDCVDGDPDTTQDSTYAVFEISVYNTGGGGGNGGNPTT